MAKVSTQSLKSTVLDGPEGMTFVIRPRRYVSVLVFVPFWMTGWVLGEVDMIGWLLSGDGPLAFTLSFLIAWTTVGLMSIVTCLWMLWGRERVSFRRGHLVHRYELFGVSRTREFDLSHVRNLRVSTTFTHWFWWGEHKRAGIWDGIVAFDYGTKTIHFAASVDEAEAQAIIGKIRERYQILDAGDAG